MKLALNPHPKRIGIAGIWTWNWLKRANNSTNDALVFLAIERRIDVPLVDSILQCWKFSTIMGLFAWWESSGTSKFRWWSHIKCTIKGHVPLRVPRPYWGVFVFDGGMELKMDLNPSIDLWVGHFWNHCHLTRQDTLVDLIGLWNLLRKNELYSMLARVGSVPFTAHLSQFGDG